MSAVQAAAADTRPFSMRDVILDAAERRFADRGFAGTAVRDIAADAGLRNQASLYHYFKNKRAIYDAVLARGVSSLVPLWQDAGAAVASAPAGDAAGRAAAFAAYLDRVLDYLIEHPHLARLIERAGLDEDRYVRGAVPRLLRPLYATGMRVLEDAGVAWQPSELPHVAAGLYHLIFGYFANASLLHAVLQEDPRSPEMLARQRRFLKAAVAALLSATPAAGAPRLIKRQEQLP